MYTQFKFIPVINERFTFPCGFRNVTCSSAFFSKVLESDDSILPHSLEISNTHKVSSETVSYYDYSPGTNLVIGSQYDSVHEETVSNNISLQDFMSRPILIRHMEWQVNTLPTFSPLDPWDAFIRNRRVMNRISNYKLLRCKLHVRVLVNGSPMHFGRLIMCYRPLPFKDDVLQTANPPTTGDLVNLSQLPHMYVNPTTSQGGDMELPFLWPENALDLNTASFGEMGQLEFYPLTFLRHANAGTTDVQICVFAWATDVVLSTPTQANIEGILPQSRDEYSMKPFSVRASNLASLSAKFSKAPIIGPYARATTMAANAASAIATLFGFSKPVELSRTIVSMQTTGPMAVSNTIDNSVKLSLDAKQELSIDPRSFGLSNCDEMEILHVAKTETYLTDFTWDPGNSQPAGTILWNCVVDPCLFAAVPAVAPNIPKIHMTAPCFATIPFQYWRGSLKYRFQVVCSALHKGRLRIVYDPEGECSFIDPTKTTPEYNVAYSTVVDISETQDFEITVGWGQSTSYREHATLDIPPNDLYDISPVPYLSSQQIYGNGVLGVYIVNELVTPSASAEAVSIIVSVSVGDDFEVAAPTSRFLNNLRYRTFADIPAAALIVEDEEIKPQSAEEPLGAVDPMVSGMAEAVETLDTVADVGSLTSDVNLVFMGETIRSFRTLLKRFSLCEMMTMEGPVPVGVNAFQFYRTAMPLEPGFTDKSFAASSVTKLVGGKQYVYAYLTPLRYISSGFAGWRGSIRWKVGLPSACCNEMVGPATLSRSSGCTPENIQTAVVQPVSTASTKATFISIYDQVSGPEGITAEYTTRNPLPSIEIPFYSRFRFAYARSLTWFRDSLDSQFYPCWKLSFNMAAPTLNFAVINTFCAAGEDFTLGMFLGAPVFYLENIPPS